eukprot:CAMPEP_0197427202 /NCGR_PEP_ID=MMETSP1170-20131217/37589_1 /TAXON_ID=54406 /ORGANISM="Sarcinochrysis sp, Strain CCMP770" /LENGTH=78 /DNA_ID=CAMNT_0042954881 /DNA_START=47 /DNA_END=283 /DNA_ORIENTATION=+
METRLETGASRDSPEATPASDVGPALAGRKRQAYCLEVSISPSLREVMTTGLKSTRRCQRLCFFESAASSLLALIMTG